MPRVRRGFKARRRRKKWLKLAKGFRGGRQKYRKARETVMRALRYAYRDRRQRKRQFRRLWITRINAATRQRGLSYSQFICGLGKANVGLDRKVLADIAVHDPDAFTKLVELAREKI